MSLRDLTNLPKIVTRPCNEAQEERNWQAVNNAINNIVNNVNEIASANGLPNLSVDIDNEAVLPMQARWAISLGDTPGDDENFIEPVADNNWRGMIRALPCDDSGGSNPNPTHIWVILPEREGISVNLPEGAVFAYEETPSGEYVAVSDYSAGTKIYWGKAQGNSTSGDPGEVTVRQCDDADGNNPVLPNLTVLLPQHNGSLTDIKTGDVIAYVETDDGTLVCVSDYTDTQTIYRFELTNSLTPGSNTSAEFVVWNGAAYAKNGTAIVVYDTNSPGRWRGVSGYRGLAAYFPDRGTYEIIFLEEIAEYAVVTLAERMGATNAGQSIGATVNSYWNGNDPGGTITVYDEQSLWQYLKSGMKLMVHYDWKNGRYKPIGFDNRVFMCQAQHNWKLNSTVSVKLWDGAAAVGTAFFANLSYAAVAGAHHGDPNVVKGDVIMCMVNQDNEVVVIDPLAWDAPIGTVWMWNKIYDDSASNLGAIVTGKYISGWALMDSTYNSVGNGGSGRYMQDYFVRVHPNTTAPTDTAYGGDGHIHTLELDYSTTGISVSVADHPDHVHEVGCANTTKDVPNGGSNYYGLISMTDQHSPSGVFFTGIQKAQNDHSSTHGSLTLSHTVTLIDPYHTHSGVTGNSSDIPPYKTMHLIERVDNSFDTIGI